MEVALATHRRGEGLRLGVVEAVVSDVSDGDSVEDVSKGRAARLARLGTSGDERAKVQLIARPCRGHASKHPVDFPLFGALPVGRVDTTFTKPYTKLAKRLRSGSSLKLDHRVG